MSEIANVYIVLICIPVIPACLTSLHSNWKREAFQ